jgi:hypothetical protein
MKRLFFFAELRFQRLDPLNQRRDRAFQRWPGDAIVALGTRVTAEHFRGCIHDSATVSTLARIEMLSRHGTVSPRVTNADSGETGAQNTLVSRTNDPRATPDADIQSNYALFMQLAWRTQGRYSWNMNSSFTLHAPHVLFFSRSSFSTRASSNSTVLVRASIILPGSERCALSHSMLQKGSVLSNVTTPHHWQ